MNLESFEVGFNIPAKVGMDVDEIQTPSLIIDYKIFENNILKMKEFDEKNNLKNIEKKLITFINSFNCIKIYN